MSIELFSLLQAIVVAVITSGLTIMVSLRIFYYNREQQYHTLLTLNYGNLFSQYRQMRSAVLSHGDRHNAATEIYAAIYNLKLVDRDASRVKKLEEIRASAKVLAEHLPQWGESQDGDIQIQEQLNRFDKTIDTLIPLIRSETIDNRPLQDLFK